MAAIDHKLADNVAGRYYVDEQCIDCDLCRQEAPNNFTRNENAGYSYVFEQPATPEEIAACQALAGCPVEAIGDDGCES